MLIFDVLLLDLHGDMVSMPRACAKAGTYTLLFLKGLDLFTGLVLDILRYQEAKFRIEN